MSATPPVFTNYPAARAMLEALPLAESLRRHRVDPAPDPLTHKIEGFRLWIGNPGDVVTVTTESGAVWNLVVHEKPAHQGGKHLSGLRVDTNGAAKQLLEDLYAQGKDPQPPAEIWLHDGMRFGNCTTPSGAPLDTSPVTSVSLNGVRML